MPAREIKTTLAIDGEKQFKSAMDEAYRGMKVLGSEMKLNTAIFADNAASMEALTKKGEILGKEVSQQKQIVAALAKAVEEAAAAYGESDKRTDDYRVKLNNATATLAKMEGELSANESAIQGMGKETQEAEKKTSTWTDTLKKCADVMGKGIVAAAKATGVAIAAVGTAAAAAAKGAYDLTMKFTETAGAIDDSSKKVGMSAENYQKWAYAAKLGGMEMSTLESAMIKQQKMFSDASTGSKTAAAAYKKLGINIRSIGGSEKAFDAVIAKLADMKDETQRNALANDIFGKSYAELAPLLSEGSAGIDALRQEAVDLGAVMSNESIAAGASFGDTMDRIKASASGVAGTLATMLLPAFQSVGTDVQALMANVNTALQDGFQPEDIRLIGDMVAQKLVEGVNAISQYLPSIMTTVSSVLTQLVGMIVTLLPTLLPTLMDGATQLITGLLQAIQANSAPLMATVVTIVTQFSTFLIENIPLLITAATEMITSLAKGITDALPQLIPAAIDGILTFATAIIDNLPDIIAAGLEVLVALVKGIIDALPKLIDRIPEIIDAIVDTTMANLDLIIQAGVDLTVAIAKGLIDAIPRLVEKLPQIITSIVNGIGDGMGKILDVGKNVVSGLWEGISASADWLYTKLKGWIGDALGWIADFLGIKSPSTVMRDRIGLNMGKGVAVGIADSAKYVNKAMENLMPDTTSTGVMLDVTRRFNDVASDAAAPAVKKVQSTVTTQLSDASIVQIGKALKSAIADQGDMIMVMNEREMARWVRGVVPA